MSVLQSLVLHAAEHAGDFMQMTRGPKYRFEFPDASAVIITDRLGDIDDELLSALMRRVEERGWQLLRRR